MRALDAGQAQVIFALGALFVDVRFAILPAVLSKFEPLCNTVEKRQKRAILLLTLVDIS